MKNEYRARMTWYWCIRWRNPTLKKIKIPTPTQWTENWTGPDKDPMLKGRQSEILAPVHAWQHTLLLEHQLTQNKTQPRHTHLNQRSIHTSQEKQDLRSSFCVTKTFLLSFEHCDSQKHCLELWFVQISKLRWIWPEMSLRVLPVRAEHQLSHTLPTRHPHFQHITALIAPVLLALISHSLQTCVFVWKSNVL